LLHSVKHLAPPDPAALGAKYRIANQIANRSG